jgi:hypothetical protein
MRFPGFALAQIVLFGVAAAQAQDPFHRFWTDTTRNNLWPDTFASPDRDAVRMPLATMAENGWRRQNLFGDHHFETDGTTLTEAGRLKVQWILTEGPEQHRILFVRRADTPEKTAARVASIQQAAATVLLPGQQAMVLETYISPPGWPADRVDIIFRKFLTSQPIPRLSPPGGATATGGGTNGGTNTGGAPGGTTGGPGGGTGIQ